MDMMHKTNHNGELGIIYRIKHLKILFEVLEKEVLEVLEKEVLHLKP